jgi:hypothetical protein
MLRGFLRFQTRCILPRTPPELNFGGQEATLLATHTVRVAGTATLVRQVPHEEVQRPSLNSGKNMRPDFGLMF